MLSGTCGCTVGCAGSTETDERPATWRERMGGKLHGHAAWMTGTEQNMREMIHVYRSVIQSLRQGKDT